MMNGPADVQQKSRESTGDRRAAIALAVRDLIVEKGFEGLRTRDIAERVGINIATLHYHVPTKEALIALVAEWLKAEFAAQGAAHEREGRTPLELIEQEFDDFAELLGTRNDMLTVMSEMLERGRRDETIRASIGPLMGKWKRMVEDILAAGRTSGDFRPDLDPAPAAQMLVSAMVGFSRSPGASPENFVRMRAELQRAIRNPSRFDKDAQP